jgi:Protein of unknown function (DUF4235)
VFVVRILFAPFSIAAGLAAGLLGRQLFELVWGRIDEEEAPEPSHHRTTWTKVLAAAAIQGAVFSLVRALTDRGARAAFYRLTGRWPGEEERDETE